MKQPESSDMANGGGGSSREYDKERCTNPSNIHLMNPRSMVYQGAVYQTNMYESDVPFNPRASWPPEIPADEIDGIVPPVGLNEYIFRIMWLQGQIPFGYRSENHNVDGNSWLWLDIHANGMFSNPQVRQARRQPPPDSKDGGEGKKQTKD